MKYLFFIRLLLLPVGFLFKVGSLAKNGSRDIHNKLRFKNAIIDEGCCINEESEIGQFVHLFANCTVNYSRIESFTYIGANSLIQNTKIGKFCSIANDVQIGLGRHPIDNFSTSPLFYRTTNPLRIKLMDENSDFQEYLPIEIGNDVWIGVSSIILDGITIGTGAIVAANSVVTKNVPPYAIVGGVPARVIKKRFSDAKIKQLLDSEWWDSDLSTLKNNTSKLNINTI